MTEPPKIGGDDLQAYIDGRLSDESRAEVETYFRTHPDEQSQAAYDRQVRDMLRAGLSSKFNEPIPERLRVASLMAHHKMARKPPMPRIAAYAASLLLIGGLAGWFSNNFVHSKMSAPNTLRQDAESAYRTFVVDVAHPVEIRANDEAHLLMWLSTRTGRPILAPDLVRFGFRFMGGRLLPGPDSPAAMLMYDDDRGTRLTVYIRNQKSNKRSFDFIQDGQVATCIWLDPGLGLAVTASTDRDRLLPIGKAVYRSFDDHG